MYVLNNKCYFKMTSYKLLKVKVKKGFCIKKKKKTHENG